MKLSWIFVILLLVIVAIFSVQNADAVTVRFLRWEVTMSAALVIQIAALLGAVVVLAVGAFSRRPARKDRGDTVAVPPGDRSAPALSGQPLPPSRPVVETEREVFRPRD